MAATLRPRHPPTRRSIFRSLSFRPPQRSNRQHRPNPDGSRPAHGVGERRRHDLMAPLIYPRRENKKPMSGRSSSWLLCWFTLFCDFSDSILVHDVRESTDTYMMYDPIFTVHTTRTSVTIIIYIYESNASSIFSSSISYASEVGV